ncbi:MAG: branched-chain amino acid ABC transporter permease [SAR324 cluster bacterium]|nr:branched-chain amino acid ABC transporter permease [SAR324 cluster bacterium]
MASLPHLFHEFMLLQTLLGGFVQGCIYSLIALGFVLIYRATRQINFAQGDLLMLGAYLGMQLQLWGVSWSVALLLSLLLLFLYGSLLQLGILSSLPRESRISVILMTLGLGFVLRSLATMIWGPAPLFFPSPYEQLLFTWQALVISGAQLGVLIGSLIAWLAVWCLLYRSRLGLGLRALAQDYWMAQASGVSCKRMEALVWGLSATLAALGGILLAPLSLVHSELGWLSIKAFAAAVLFGFGNVTGAVFGGLLLGITEQLSAAWFPDISRDLVSYLILLFWLWLRGSNRIGSAAIVFSGKS